MEIVRYLNGLQVSENELSQIKAVTPEMAEAVNEVRRRAADETKSAVKPERSEG